MIGPLTALSAPRIAAIAFVVGLVAGIGLTGWIATVRLDAAESRRAAEVAELRHAHEQAVRMATEEHARALQRARATEHALLTDLERIQTQYAKEKTHAQAESERVIADLRAGTRRLRVAVRSCSAGAPGGPAPGAAAAGGSGGAASAELDPQTGADLYAIARDGDDAIRSLNACIGAYQAVRARINAGDGAP